MKKPLSFFAALLAFFAFSSFVNITPETCSIAVKKGNIFIQGSKVTPSYALSNFKNALGEPDRTRDGYNKTHTYDQLSIVLFETEKDKVPTGVVSEFQMHFSVPESNDVTPKGDGFKGKLKVDKLVVTKNLTATIMLAKLKGWKKTDSYLEHSYRMAKGPIYIYFQFNAAESELVKVSIGPNKDK